MDKKNMVIKFFDMEGNLLMETGFRYAPGKDTIVKIKGKEYTIVKMIYDGCELVYICN